MENAATPCALRVAAPHAIGPQQFVESAAAHRYSQRVPDGGARRPPETRVRRAVGALRQAATGWAPATTD